MTDNEENNKGQVNGENIAGDIHIGRSVSSRNHIFNDESDEEMSNVDFSVEFETIFSHIADRLYGSDEAAIREGLTNSVTSILRARDRGLISESEGLIEFEVHEGGEDESGALVMRDNGIGMSRDEIENVVAKVGATTSKTEGNLAGQFGMGFLALFKLVGLDDAAFIMYSNSRLNDKPPISGSWNSKGFSPVANRKLAGSFNEDDNGVKFYFPLKDDISTEDLVNYIRENASFSRVPVLLKYYNQKNELQIDDELGGDNVLDEVDESEPFVEYEDEFIHAICAPNCPNKTILLDVPVERGYMHRRMSLPFKNLMIRLKNEKGVVVEGPNKGSMRVSDVEYSSLQNHGLSEDFINESSISRNDITMPRPKTNRDGLERNSRFWDWVEDKIATEYNDMLVDIGSKISSLDDVFELDDIEFQLFTSQIPNVERDLDDFSKEEYIEKWNDNNVRGSFSDDLIEKIGITTSTVGEATLDKVMACNQASGRYERMICEVVHEIESDGDLYIGVSMNPSRVKVVLEDSKNNKAISVDNTEWYEILQDWFGAKLLNNVTKDRLDEFDIDSETIEFFSEYTASSKKDVKMREKSIKIHFGQMADKKETFSQKISFGDFEEILNDDDSSLKYNPEKIVVFTRTCGYRVSDYKFKVACKKVPIVSLTKAQLDAVKDCPKIVTAPDFMSQSESKLFMTRDGEMELREIVDQYKPIFHIVPDDTIELFRKDSIIHAMEDICRSSVYWSGIYYYSDDDDCYLTNSNARYVPLTLDEYRKTSMVVYNENITVIANEVFYNKTQDAGNTVSSIPSDSALYIDAVNEIHDNVSMSFFSKLLHQNDTRLDDNKDEVLALKNSLLNK